MKSPGVTNLYEKKLLTYSRTDSAFLTDDMEETAAKGKTVLAAVIEKLVNSGFIERSFYVWIEAMARELVQTYAAALDEHFPFPLKEPGRNSTHHR